MSCILDLIFKNQLFNKSIHKRRNNDAHFHLKISITINRRLFAINFIKSQNVDLIKLIFAFELIKTRIKRCLFKNVDQS